MLDGKVATTKREVVEPEFPPIDTLRAKYPQIAVQEAGLIDNGSIITGGGVALCIDATLYLLESLLGAECAQETARIMEYTNARAANTAMFPPIIVNATNDGRDRFNQGRSAHSN